MSEGFSVFLYFSVFLLHPHLFSHPSMSAPRPRGYSHSLLFGARLMGVRAGSLTPCFCFSLGQVLCVSEVGLSQYFCSCSQTPPPTCGWFWVNLSSLSPNRTDSGLNFQPEIVPCFSPWSRGLLLLFSPKNQWVFKCQRRTRRFFTLHLEVDESFPGGSVVKNPPANAGDVGSISGSGRSPGGGNGNPLQYSCLGNLMDRAAWRATVNR